MVQWLGLPTSTAGGASQFSSWSGNLRSYMLASVAKKQAPKMGENICIWIIMMTEESTLFNIINKEMHMKTIQTYFDFQDIKI